MNIPKEDLNPPVSSPDPVVASPPQDPKKESQNMVQPSPEFSPEAKQVISEPGEETASSVGEVLPGQGTQPPTSPSESAQNSQDNDEAASSEVSLEIKSYMTPFIYDSIQQKDPFEDPTAVVTKETDVKGKKVRRSVIVIPKTPPEEYDLTNIKLKGIAWNTAVPKALFKLPGNKGYYTLAKGDRIGRKGVVFDIKENEVFIVEENYVGSGDKRRKKQVVKIKKMDRIGLSNK